MHFDAALFKQAPQQRGRVLGRLFDGKNEFARFGAYGQQAANQHERRAGLARERQVGLDAGGNG